MAGSVSVIVRHTVARRSKPEVSDPIESPFEGPEDIHIVGRNASNTQPAKTLAMLVKKKGAPALVPVK